MHKPTVGNNRGTIKIEERMVLMWFNILKLKRPKCLKKLANVIKIVNYSNFHR